MGGKCPERWQGIASGSGIEILFLMEKIAEKSPARREMPG